MKASKLLTKKQSQVQYGIYIVLGFNKMCSFEYYLINSFTRIKPTAKDYDSLRNKGKRVDN